MNEKKFIKAFGFSSLALLMACTGLVTFAPIGASASEPPATTTNGLGLAPKNDPVVYTTESGLEIRMSNATKYSGTTTLKTNRNYSYTQDLSSFYYFTMGTYSGTIYTATSKTATYTVTNEPVNWIILGLGENTAYFLDEVAKNLFSTWKANSNGIQYPTGNSGVYFFNEIYETYSPAGQLIDSAVSAKTYIMDKVKASINTNPDIPNGCMLVLSEKILGQMYFNSSGALNYVHSTSDYFNYMYGNGNYGNRYRYFGAQNVKTTNQSWTTSGNAGGSLYNYINSLFSKNNSTGAIISNSLGFTQEQANMILPQQLYTHYYNGSTHYQETPTTDGNTYYSLFPLSSKTSNTSITQNFCIEDYLTTNSQRISSLIGSTQSFTWWTRSAFRHSSNTNYCYYAKSVFPTGELSYNGVADSHGARPAMVMKLK